MRPISEDAVKDHPPLLLNCFPKSLMGSVSGTPLVVIVDVTVIVDIVVDDVAASWTRPSRTSAVLKVNISKVALSSEIFWPRQPQFKFTQIEAHPPKNDARPAVNAEI